MRSANWEKHNAVLRERTEWLNGQRFHALQYSGPGMDLTIGLADGHEWEGGASTAKNGITCNPNIPTEEVFTTPHCRRVERPCREHKAAVLSGHADRQHPGAIRGRQDRRGQGVARRGGAEQGARHRRGRAAARRSGAGAAFLADLGKAGLLFFNTLFDENAASPHRARPVLFEMLRRWRQADAAADRGAGRQPEPDPYRLDDRLWRDRHRRHAGRRQQRAGIPQRRVGD